MPIRVFTEEEKEKLREGMLSQAFELLAKYGLKHMSVDKITKQVGIGKSTFYSFFESKEDYVSQAIELNRKKMLDRLDAVFMDAKMPPARLFDLFFNRLLCNNSIYRNFSAEDERALYELEKSHGKEVSLDREKAIAQRIFKHVEGVREDYDMGLCANYIKLIVLAYENAYLFHPSHFEKMQDELRMRLIDLVFEEEAKKDLLEAFSKGKSQRDGEEEGILDENGWVKDV